MQSTQPNFSPSTSYHHESSADFSFAISPRAQKDALWYTPQDDASPLSLPSGSLSIHNSSMDNLSESLSPISPYTDFDSPHLNLESLTIAGTSPPVVQGILDPLDLDLHLEFPNNSIPTNSPIITVSQPYEYEYEEKVATDLNFPSPFDYLDDTEDSALFGATIPMNRPLSGFALRSATESNLTALVAHLEPPARRASHSIERPRRPFQLTHSPTFSSPSVASTSTLSPALSVPALEPQPISPSPELKTKDIVATAANIQASKMRRKNPARFSCEFNDICQQTFTAKHNLNNHMRAHTGARPHKCPMCTYAARTLDVIKRHRKSCGNKKDRKPRSSFSRKGKLAADE
ncbi:Zinc finger protein3-like [Mycena indigotica]|uniref:Zinc finger protein3-like n=1 Tax=Mycena indigotica TaxID=2126181 RepID=A0A8H6WHF8_9AGAR|nr:Zinc finger protein3-like [Mycena indigotica]KAF7312429.1 Zinc finger protein3-like [Mycena indigotica]